MQCTHPASVTGRRLYNSAMQQANHTVSIQTRGKGLYAFTDRVQEFVRGAGMRDGLLTLFVQHTSASLLIQENYDPDVQGDLERYFSRLAPEGDPLYRHTLEGPDDMPAHVRAALTQTSLSLPVISGKLALGTWQGIYLFEHRRQAQIRRVILHLLGE
jgi:secondary thiamine-phosphate synthase enzyme